MTDRRISSLYQRNLRHVGRDDIVLGGYGGSGQSLVANVLQELGLNYVDPYTEEILPDGTSAGVPGHAAFRNRLSAMHRRDTGERTEGRIRHRPRFFKTHLPPEVFSHRDLSGVWLVVRDPRDALYSWYRWRADFGEEPWDRADGTFEEFITGPDFTGRLPTEDWSLFYEEWLRRARDIGRYTVTRFEDVKRSPRSTMRRALDDLGVDVADDALDSALHRSSFEAMRGHEDQVARSTGARAEGPRIMRRGKVGEWQEWMTPALARPFAHDGIRATAQRFGYSLPADPQGS